MLQKIISSFQDHDTTELFLSWGLQVLAQHWLGERDFPQLRAGKRRNPVSGTTTAIPLCFLLAQFQTKSHSHDKLWGILVFVQPELQQRVWVVWVSLTQEDSRLSKPSFCLQQQQILCLGRGSCLYCCLSCCLQTASALCWFLMVWRGWKWEEGAKIFYICNFDKAAVVEVGFYPLCLKQGTVPFCKFSDAKRNTQKIHLSYCRCRLL